METSQKQQIENSTNSNQKPPDIHNNNDSSGFQFYSIPSRSSWFDWDKINEIEKTSLKEFFDGSSFTRNPKIYKDYRDFIISKYRENPSRRLTFSDVRKSLVGDVGYLHKVFKFLEKWGLINFGAKDKPKSAGGGSLDTDIDIDNLEGISVRTEEGPPYGIKVVAFPNSQKHLMPPQSEFVNNGGGLAASAFKMAPLASHSDVYSDLIKLKAVTCGNCKEQCDSSHYECTKEGSFKLCMKCFKNGNFGDSNSADDFKFVDCTSISEKDCASWSEADTLLLLESVLKHGDDWDLIAQAFPKKSKLDCISKLVQLPFGELMLGSAYDRCRYWDTGSSISSVKRAPIVPIVAQGTIQTSNINGVPEANQQNQDADGQGPSKRLRIEPISDCKISLINQSCQDDRQVPSEGQETMETEVMKQNENYENQQSSKKICYTPTSDASISLMGQVARICTMVGPQVTASAAEAAITAICDENSYPREVFDCDINGEKLGSADAPDRERAPLGKYSEMDEQSIQSELLKTFSVKSAIPVALRMRAASATAIGAAAANAKLLAVKEEREIESLVATVIETQMKKLNSKAKLLKDLELIMEEEFTHMEELEESLVAERIDVIERVLGRGISRWKHHSSTKSNNVTELL